MCVSIISRWFCSHVVILLFINCNRVPCPTPSRGWLHRSYETTQIHVGIMPKWSWGWRKEVGVVVLFTVECHIRRMLLPKYFWGGTSHIEVMTQRAEVLAFLHIPILSRETVFQGMKICSCCKSVWGWNIIHDTQLYLLFIPLFTDFRQIFLTF